MINIQISLYTITLLIMTLIQGGDQKHIEISVSEETTDVRERINGLLTYGNDIKIKEDEILIVNLWGTWCQPCIGEIPSLNRLVKDYSNDKVRFLAFSDEHPDRLKMYNFKNFQKRKSDFVFEYEQNFGQPEIPKYIRSLDTIRNGKGVPIHLLVKADGTLGRVLLGASETYEHTIRKFIDNELNR